MKANSSRNSMFSSSESRSSRTAWIAIRSARVAVMTRGTLKTGSDPALTHGLVVQGGIRGELARLALVPRTRSAHHNCRKSDCELRVQSGTRTIELLVSFDSEVRNGTCCKLGRTSESGHW